MKIKKAAELVGIKPNTASVIIKRFLKAKKEFPPKQKRKEKLDGLKKILLQTRLLFEWRLMNLE